ncbi:reverse transcriptase domain-containing protein [Tanacetum coccineum]
MSKVLQERGFGSLPSSTETNPMDHVKSILTAKADSTGIRRIGSGLYAVSDSQFSNVFSKTVPFPRRLHDYYYDEWNEARKVKILETYSNGTTLHDNTLPQKEKDPRSFTLPCFIHNVCFDNALVDLGASVIVMPFSTYTNLGLGDLAHTRLIVDLADRTIKHPRGIAEMCYLVLDKDDHEGKKLVGTLIDMPIFVGNFSIISGFTIIDDMDENVTSGVVLGMPFCKKFVSCQKIMDKFAREDEIQEIIIFDPDDQPMWESAKTVAPTPNSAIIQLDVDDNFVINSTHLNMIRENKFDVICGRSAVHIHEPTQAILDVTAGGIFLYKSPNQAFQLLKDKVLFNLDWSTKSKNEHHHKSVVFADGSNSNNDKFRLMEKLASLTIKIDSQIISLNEELQDIHNKYNELRNGNASKNHLNDDTPMCERHEANFNRSEDHQNRISHDSYSHQSHHDRNDSEKSLIELNNDVRNDLEDFKRCIRSMRTVHWKLYDRDDHKTTGVLLNKKFETINQEPQSKTDFEKSITKFLDGQRVTNMFFKNNINDMILKMKQNEKNFQTIFKNMERKIDEWEKSQNVFSKQTDRTDPPPPQAHTEHVNVVFTGSGKSDYSLKNLKDPPPFIIVNNKIKKGRPIKTSKRDITW